MSFYLSNPDVVPTGWETAEFIDDVAPMPPRPPARIESSRTDPGGRAELADDVQPPGSDQPPVCDGWLGQ